MKKIIPALMLACATPAFANYIHCESQGVFVDEKDGSLNIKSRDMDVFIKKEGEQYYELLESRKGSKEEPALEVSFDITDDVKLQNLESDSGTMSLVTYTSYTFSGTNPEVNVVVQALSAEQASIKIDVYPAAPQNTYFSVEVKATESGICQTNLLL